MSMILLNPPSLEGKLANREGTASFGALSDGFLYPPHTLAVLVAACRRAGLDVSVLDAVAERLDLAATVERLRRLDAEPAALAIYCSWGTIDADREQIAGLRAEFPQTPIIVVGTGVRYSCDEFLVAGASHILLGDPELALPALLAKPLPPSGIIKTQTLLPDEHNHAGLLRDPAALPRPAWDAVPWESYGFLTLFGARGCEDRCRFCAYVTVQGRAYRPRPAQDVVDEMVWLQNTFQPRRIMARDPVFAQNRARTMEIARELKAAGFHTPWECESRPEHFDAALLKQLAAAGCNVIKLGLESADPAMLVALGRIDAEEDAAHYLAYTRRVVADAQRCGIRTRVYVLVGVPGQTQTEVETTAAYLRELQPTFVHPRPYIAYPRVPLGPAQSPDLIARWQESLQAVAEERLAVANRPPSLAARIRRRLRLSFSG